MATTTNKGKILTFGEVIMRLSPGNYHRMAQTNHLNYYFGGTELNVAISLARYGESVKHVSSVSNDFVGEAAKAEIRKHGIDISHIRKVDHPLGLYFLEIGSSIRSSQISYNRLHGAFAKLNPDDFNWEQILEDVTHFHWTGITPGISEAAYIALKQGLQAAREKNIEVSTDPAYRSNLWKFTDQPFQILKELVDLSTIFIGGVGEINEILQTSFDKDDEGFVDAAKELQNQCPSIKKVFDKVRDSLSASHQKIYSIAYVDQKFLKTNELEVTPVVDRIGTGDAFAGGLIYGIRNLSTQEALEFGNAACAIKHTIDGDANLTTVDEVMQAVKGKISGKVNR